MKKNEAGQTDKVTGRWHSDCGGLRRLLRSALWAKPGVGGWSRPGEQRRWEGERHPQVNAWGHGLHTGCCCCCWPRLRETGGHERTLSTGVGHDLCPSRATLATSRKLSLEEQEQKQDQLQACKKQGRHGGGWGGRGVFWARVEAVERGIHSWTLAVL